MSLTLANAALWKRQTTDPTSIGTGLEFSDYPESMRYYTRSLRALAETINQGPSKIGLSIVGGVLGLACHDVSGSPLGPLSAYVRFNNACCAFMLFNTLIS
jgi:hypothetical protein